MLAAALAVGPGGAQAEPAGALPEPIRQALAASGIPDQAVSIRVSDARGQVRLDWQTSVVRETGSLIKLVTTLAALDQLGPAHRFHTDLLAEPVGRPHGAWQLWLRGGGDPAFRYQDLAQLLRAAAASGVGRLVPTVRVDDSRFAPEQALGSGVEMTPDSAGAVLPQALQVEWSTLTLTLPAGEGARPWLEPPFPLDLRGWRTDAQAAGCPADWPQSVRLHAAPAVRPRVGAETAALVLEGHRGRDCAEATLLRAPLDSRRYLELALNTAWQALGHRERLVVESGPAPSYASVQLRQPSRPLAELVRDTNKFSNNLMARTLLLDLAAEAGELPATPEAGDRLVRAWLAQQGLGFEELQLENGAGLSHRERITAEHLDALLKYALTTSAAAEFRAALPIPGQDGSLRTRFRDLPGAERLRLKSGALDGVRSLAGYVQDRQGGVGTLVCIVNHPEAARATAFQQAVLAWALGVDPATPEPAAVGKVRESMAAAPHMN